MNDATTKTSSTAAKIKQAADSAVVANELKHIKNALNDLKATPPKHECVQDERITDVEKDLAGISSRSKVWRVVQGIVVAAALTFGLFALQVCSTHDSSIAEARTINANQTDDIKSLSTGLRRIETAHHEQSTRVIEAVSELRGEVRAMRQEIREPRPRRRSR